MCSEPRLSINVWSGHMCAIYLCCGVAVYVDKCLTRNEAALIA